MYTDIWVTDVNVHFANSDATLSKFIMQYWTSVIRSLKCSTEQDLFFQNLVCYAGQAVFSTIQYAMLK